MTVQTAELPGRLSLEKGGELTGVEIAYKTWGSPRPEAILICHALTGNAEADDWWGGLFGPGATFDAEQDFVIATNVLGGCYGSTGPTTIEPGTRKTYGARFPELTIRDLVNAQARLLEFLGVERVKLVIGGSMGGMQAQEWAAMYGDRVDAAVSIGAGSSLSAWTLAFSEAQRAAILADPRYLDGNYQLDDGPDEGLAIARMIAMISYRAPTNFNARFGRRKSEDEFQIQSYLRYQGVKLVERFDANTYLRLMGAMDSHDIGRGRGGAARALSEIRTPMLAVGITSDNLYPPEEVETLANGMPNSRYVTLEATEGHDAFLIRTGQLNRLVRAFLDDVDAGSERLWQTSVLPGRGAAWA